MIGGSPCNDLSIVNPARKGLYGKELKNKIGTELLTRSTRNISLWMLKIRSAEHHWRLSHLFSRRGNWPVVFRVLPPAAWGSTKAGRRSAVLLVVWECGRYGSQWQTGHLPLSRGTINTRAKYSSKTHTHKYRFHSFTYIYPLREDWSRGKCNIVPGKINHPLYNTCWLYSRLFSLIT